MSPTLPPIHTTQVGMALVPTTNARELHTSLKVGRDFSTWLKGRIAEHGFVEGVDYVIVAAPPIRGAGNRGAKDEYHLTLDMAKELAMVENNDRGREVRRYFIAAEQRGRAGGRIGPAPGEISETFRAYREIASLIGMDANQSALGAARATRRAHGVNPLEELGATHLLAPQQERHITVTEVGIRLGSGKAKVTNVLLERHGYQTGARDHKGRLVWEPTEKGQPLAVILDTDKTHGGAPVRQLRWLPSVVDALRSDIAGEGST